MAEVITMPRLSDTMTEGKIVAWNKKVGDTVKADESLADVETDKATMEVVPYVDGTVLYTGVEAGSAAKINEVIAVIGKAGTDVAALVNAFKNPGAAAQPQAAGTAAPARRPGASCRAPSARRARGAHPPSRPPPRARSSRCSRSRRATPSAAATTTCSTCWKRFSNFMPKQGAALCCCRQRCRST